MKCLEYVPVICEGCERRQRKQKNSHMCLFVVTVLYMVNTQHRDVQQVLNEAKNSGFILLMQLLMRLNEQLTHIINEKYKIQPLSGTNIYLTSHLLYLTSKTLSCSVTPEVSVVVPSLPLPRLWMFLLLNNKKIGSQLATTKVQ